MNNQFVLNKQKTLRCKTPIVLLLVIALICTIFSCITYFVNYDYQWNNGNPFYELTVGFPNIIDLLWLVLALAPYVLFALYVLKFHNGFKATILVPITFGLIAIKPLFLNIIYIIFGYGFYFSDLIFNLPITVAFTLVTINALKGLSKKAFLIVAIVGALILDLFSVFNSFPSVSRYIEESLYLYFFTWITGFLGAIAFYIALLLFGLNNRIPAILSASTKKEKRNIEKISPEQALRLLKDKLDFGMITEEEYQMQRTEIIRKL